MQGNSKYSSIQYVTNPVLLGRTGMRLVLKGQTCKMLGVFLSWDTGWEFLDPTEFPKCLASNNLKDWMCCIVLFIAQLSFV